jgi:hypothetical protein
LPNGICSRPVTKCQPARTLRAKRGLVSLWAVGFTLALIVFLLAGPGRNEIISPGGLTLQHATVVDSCAGCHTSADKGPADWFRSARTGTSQPALCLKCHMMGEHSTNPHGIAAVQLAKVTKRMEGDERLSHQLASGRAAKSGQLACSTCHKEHRGRAADLTRLSNQQCQSCHRIRFKSVGNGHPKFEQYPYERRTRLKFDHAAHQARHFTEKGKEFRCNACHVPGSEGERMGTRPYHESCRECHDADVRPARGMPVFNCPGIDTETLAGIGMAGIRRRGNDGLPQVSFQR